MHHYANTTVVGAGADRTARAVAALDTPSYVSPAGGAMIVFAESDEIDRGGPPIASEVSAVCDCVAIAIAVRENQHLSYQLFERGMLVDVAVLPALSGAWPKGDADRMVRAFGGGDRDTLRSLLITDAIDATELHRQVFEALELPTAGVGWSYSSITSDGIDYPTPLIETRAVDGMSMLA